MLAAMAGSTQLKASGVDLSALDQRGGLPDELMGEFMATGDMTSCAATVDRLLEAGADRVVLVPNPAGYRSTLAMVGQMRTVSVLVRARR
jgi:alkanesulfonate monooxygenase SsuD/methylene tetrahydromethanopterin reductase-like flavin-dependent oxidoreductase (luciferase family)